MGEMMSLKRACEILNECEYDNATDWEPGEKGEPGDMRWVVSKRLRKRVEASGAVDQAEMLAASYDGTLPVCWTRAPKVVEAMRDVVPRPATEDYTPPPTSALAAVPPHYDFAIQPKVAIRAWALNFALGNVVKYVVRADRKGTPIDDLVKARDYLDYEIAERRKGAAK